MATIRTINTEGFHDTVYIKGQNRNLDIGLRVDIDATETVNIKHLVVENTFIPLIKSGDGRLNIEQVQLKDFGGDGINIWGNNVHIGKLVVRNNTPTRPYDSVRVDCLAEEAILAALQASGQAVYDWRLLQWIENQTDGKTCYYTPGYHTDIGLQAYRPNCTQPATVQDSPAGSQPKVAATSRSLSTTLPLILSTDLPQWAVQMQADTPQTRSLTARPAPIDPILAFLDQLANTPHVLHADDQNRIHSIELLAPLAKADASINTPQARNLPVCGISGISIKDVDIQSSHPKSQVFMFSEAQRYSDIKIGTEHISIQCAYPWWFVANTLDNAVIGNADNVRVNFGSPTTCKVRIGDGISGSARCIKPSAYRTGVVSIVGLGNGHRVPDNGVEIL